jgi:tripeptidyl-peptidase-1
MYSYSVYQGGELTPSGGTSAAAPVTASIIALLNDARLRAGKPTLGFLNPLIYGYAYKGFTDITSGQSDGCNGNNTQSGGGVPGVRISPSEFVTKSLLFG